jgi:hypothetical protein
VSSTLRPAASTALHGRSAAGRLLSTATLVLAIDGELVLQGKNPTVGQPKQLITKEQG